MFSEKQPRAEVRETKQKSILNWKKEKQVTGHETTLKIKDGKQENVSRSWDYIVTHSKKQATQHGCLPKLLGDGEKMN